MLLKYFELEARFPTSAEELPLAAVAYVADPMKVPAADLTSYRWTGRTIEYHRAQMFGFREFSRGDEDKLAACQAEEVWTRSGRSPTPWWTYCSDWCTRSTPAAERRVETELSDDLRMAESPSRLDQAALAQQLYDARKKTVQRIAGLFDVPRSTMYGDFDRAPTTVEPLARTPDRGATSGR